MIIKTETEVKTRGKYRTPSGMPKGLVVHYTAGRYNPLNTMRGLGEKGLACLVMDERGNIYQAKNQAIDDVGFHAGFSEWEGVSAVSYYCLGMEICCAGKLDENRVSWFGVQYDQSETRTTRGRSNIKAGTYHKYTQAQEDALIKFCLWQKKTNKEFSFDWVVGHDEIAPKRKSDPGGSLSMTMPEFRELLKSKVI